MPPTDPRYLSMTDAGIRQEFWACRFYEVVKKGRTPLIDEFDTDFVDDALEKWAEEDEDFFEVERLKSDPNEWEPVNLNG